MYTYGYQYVFTFYIQSYLVVESNTIRFRAIDTVGDKGLLFRIELVSNSQA